MGTPISRRTMLARVGAAGALCAFTTDHDLLGQTTTSGAAAAPFEQTLRRIRDPKSAPA